MTDFRLGQYRSSTAKCPPTYDQKLTMLSPRQSFILFTIRTGAVLPFTRYGEPVGVPIADLVPVYYLELQ